MWKCNLLIYRCHYTAREEEVRETQKKHEIPMSIKIDKSKNIYSMEGLWSEMESTINFDEK